MKSTKRSFKTPTRWLNRRLNILVLGCGGTGSEMLDELFRMNALIEKLGGDGIHVTAYDDDIVSGPNIGRQRFVESDIGLNKAEVLITRFNSFGGTNWSYSKRRFSFDDIGSRFHNYDLIITCVDSVMTRVNIARYGASDPYSSEMLWLDCGNDHSQGNVVLGHLGKSEGQVRLPNIFKLYPQMRDYEENAVPSCSTEMALSLQDYGVNRSVAREGANILWQLLRHGSIDHHGSYIDLKTGRTTPIPICSDFWATFGYQAA